MVTGTLVAPTVHHVAHGSEHAEAMQAARDGSCHIEAAHEADSPVLAAEHLAHIIADCSLCATRLPVVTPWPPDMPTLHLRRLGEPEPLQARIEMHIPHRVAIRGPPAHG
mgnify:CR=1 FL=1